MNDEIYYEGSQPINVLESAIKKELENILNNINLSSYNSKIKFQHGSIFHTPRVLGSGEIEIQETFQTFLWCWSYVLLTLTLENLKIMFPLEYGTKDQLKISTTLKLLEYARSLHTIGEYQSWDTDLLPNPQKASPDENEYINKINAIYVGAVIHTIFHEIGHLENNHITRKKSENNRNLEYEADIYATEKFLININKKVLDTAHIGIITAFSALLYLHNLENIQSNSHPDPNERLKRCVESLNLEDGHPIWVLASVGIKIWSVKVEKDLNWNEKYETGKDLFYAAYDASKNKN